MQLFCDDIEKKENFLDTRSRDNSYKFRYFAFLALQNLQNLQLKQPLNWLNSTLNAENKERDMLRVKMLTKIIVAIFFSDYSVGGKSTYSN